MFSFFESQDPHLAKNKFKAAFGAELTNARDLLRDLDRYVMTCVERWLNREELYAPVGVVCQSSGYGKTKLLYELARRHVTVFMCARRGNEHAESPPISHRSFRFKSCLGIRMNPQVDLYFISLIREALRQVKDIKLEAKTHVCEEEIAVKFAQAQPWFDTGEQYGELEEQSSLTKNEK